MVYSKVYSILFSVLLVTATFLSCPLNTSAQDSVYGNEWIDYSKTYYAFDVEEDGLMRISYEDLAATDLPLDASGYRLYAFGEEVPLFISGNGSLAPNDFIEFYAQKLDGYFDKQMYQEPEHHVSEEMCLFAQTATYYLTWDNNGTPLRYQTTSNEITNPPAAEEYFMYSYRRNTYNVLNRGKPSHTEVWKVWSANMEKGEAFVGPNINSDGGFFRLGKKGLYEQANQQATAEILLLSTGEPSDNQANHTFTLATNGTILAEETLAPYEIYSNTFDLPIDLINNTPVDAVDIILTPDLIEDEPWSRLAFVHGILTYPRVFELEENESIHFPLDNDADKYIEFAYAGDNLPVLYDLTTLKRFDPVVEDDLLKFHLTQSGEDEERNWFVSAINPLEVQDLKPLTFTNYSQSNFEADFLIIYNELITEGSTNEVQRYVDYRSSEEGGAHQVLAVDIEELYHQFAQGIKRHPFSIRNFCNFILNQSSTGNWSVEAEYLLLLGKSISYNESLPGNPSGYEYNLVPTYGTGGSSDHLLSAKDPYDIHAQLATGRLSARNGGELKNYLDKLIEYEAVLNTVSCDSELSWRKDVAQLIGIPINSTENDFFSEALLEYETIIEDIPSGNEVVYFAELDMESDAIAAKTEIQGVIESGLNYFNYYGSSYNADIPFFPDIENLNNNGKYPFLNIMSSFLGNVHRPQDFLMTQITLAEGEGCIGALGNSGLLAKEFIRPLMLELHENVAKDMYGSSWAKCLQQSIVNVHDEENNLLNFISEQSQFQGDPAVKPYHFDLPDYAVFESDIVLHDDSTDPEAETFTVSINIRNQGKATADMINVGVHRDMNDETETLFSEDIPDPLYETTLELEVDNSNPAELGSLRIEIDAPNNSAELCEDNNVFQIQVSTLFGLDPIGIQNNFDTYFQIAPNPVNDIISLRKSADIEYKSIAVYSSEGKQMQVGKVEDIDGQVKIDVSGLPAGAYHLIINTSKDRFGKTFVKE